MMVDRSLVSRYDGIRVSTYDGRQVSGLKVDGLSLESRYDGSIADCMFSFVSPCRRCWVADSPGD